MKDSRQHQLQLDEQGLAKLEEEKEAKPPSASSRIAALESLVLELAAQRCSELWSSETDLAQHEVARILRAVSIIAPAGDPQKWQRLAQRALHEEADDGKP